MFKLKRSYRNLLIIAILAYLALNSVLYFRVGLMPDEGNFLFTAKTMTQGYVPYKDYATDIKPPGMYYFLYPFLLVTQGWEAIRFGIFLINVLSSVVIFLLARRMYSERIALLSAVMLLVILSLPGTDGYEITADRFLVLFGALAAYSFHRSLEDRKYLVLAGVFAGTAFIFKQVGIMLLAFILLFYFLDFLQRNRNMKYAKNSVLSFLLVIVSFSIPVIAISLHFAYMGGLDKMVYWTTQEVFGLHKNNYIFYDFIGKIATMENAYQFSIMSIVWLFSFGMVLAIFYKFMKGVATHNEIFLAAWLAGVSYPFVVLLKYYMLMIAPMVILTSICLVEVFRFLKGRANLYVKSLMVTSILILLALSAAVNLYSEYKLQKYRPDFFGNVLKTSGYISEITAPGDKVYIFGYAEDIYFFSGRNPPAGLFYVYPRPITTPGEEESAIKIIMDSDVKIMVVAYKEQPLKYYVPNLYGYIQREYKLEKSFGVFDVYSKKQ